MKNYVRYLSVSHSKYSKPTIVTITRSFDKPPSQYTPRLTSIRRINTLFKTVADQQIPNYRILGWIYNSQVTAVIAHRRENYK